MAAEFRTYTVRTSTGNHEIKMRPEGLAFLVAELSGYMLVEVSRDTQTKRKIAFFDRDIDWRQALTKIQAEL